MPVEYSTTLEDAGVQKLLRDLNRDIVPRATAWGINESAKAAQANIREHLDDEMVIRRRGFANRSIKIPKFANPKRLHVAVRNEAPGDPERSDILGQHEQGDDKRPRDGRHLAVPSQGLRRTKAGVIPRALRPRSFKFKAHGGTGRVLAGDRRTVLIRQEGGGGMILQRQGPRNKRGERDRRDRRFRDHGERKDSSLVLIYRLVELGTLRPRLGFIKHGMAAVEVTLAKNFGHAFDREMTKKTVRS